MPARIKSINPMGSRKISFNFEKKDSVWVATISLGPNSRCRAFASSDVNPACMFMGHSIFLIGFDWSRENNARKSAKFLRKAWYGIGRYTFDPHINTPKFGSERE